MKYLFRTLFFALVLVFNALKVHVSNMQRAFHMQRRMSSLP